MLRTGPQDVSSPAGKGVLGLLGATFVALGLSSIAAAAPCANPPRVCQTLVIRATGPLRVYVQALSCIAAPGLTWNVTVTDGSSRVRVPVEDAPKLVPGRQVKVPHAGRWRLDVRATSSDRHGQCGGGETVSGFVAVRGPDTSQPTTGPRPRPQPNPQAAQTPLSTPIPTGRVDSARSSPSPEPSAVGNVAIPASPLAPASEADPASLADGALQQGAGPAGGSPLGLLFLFILGVAGIELIVYAIRRELRLHRRHPWAALESPAVQLRGNTLRLMNRHRPKP